MLAIKHSPRNFSFGLAPSPLPSIFGLNNPPLYLFLFFYQLLIHLSLLLQSATTPPPPPPPRPERTIYLSNVFFSPGIS